MEKKKEYPILNEFNCIGRVSIEPVSATLPSGLETTEFSVALSGSATGLKDTAFIRFVKYGDFPVAPYIKKGALIYVSSRLGQKVSEKDGVKSTYYNFVVNKVGLLGGKNDQAEVSGSADVSAVSDDDEF